MKRADILAVLGAFALIAACADKSAEPADGAAASAGSTPATNEDTASAESGDSYPQEDAPPEGATPASGPLACVKDVPADAICTMDLNQCGHSSSCNCGPGYIYSASMGKCLLIMDGIAEAARANVADDECVKTATAACTRDINVCSQPSSCQCDEGFQWNAVAGKCVKG